MIKPDTSRLYQFYRFLILPALLMYGLFGYHALFSPEGHTVFYAGWARFLVVVVLAPIVLLLGFLIMKRVPGNVIGPALIVYAATFQAEVTFAQQVSAIQAQINLFVLGAVAVPTFIVIMTHFPDGRLHARQTIPVVYGLLVAIVMLTAGGIFGAGYGYGTEYAYEEPLANPFLIDALAPYGENYAQIGAGGSTIVFMGAICLLLYRYFNVTGVERKQLRWLGFGLLTVMLINSIPQIFLFGDNPDDWVLLSTSVVVAIMFAVIPLSIGTGILFYRLWDIDVIIRRTFTYSIISLILVGTYLLIVLAAQTFLDTFIDSESSLVVVISTLGVAVLFNPVRERVQSFIDRLFNRKHYDADATLEAFRDNIRDAIEPEAIQGQLVQAVSSTIQPTSITFWKIERQP
jgi:hypothetical protein